MNITNITIILTEGMDTVLLHTDLPAGESVSTQSQAFGASIMQNGGEDYVKLNFPGIRYNVINSRG